MATSFFTRVARFVPVCLLTFVVALAQATPMVIDLVADPVPKKTISIDFDSTDAFVESGDQKGTAKKSGLSADQRKGVIAVMQKEYDDALGAGVVKVKDGVDGDVKMIVNGDTAPSRGTKYGNAGKPGKPGLVYAGEFVAAKLSGQDLINAIGETTAHEAGHKLGLSHNDDKPPGKMTRGDLVGLPTRAADSRKFNATDIKRLQSSVGLKSAEQKDTKTPGQLGIVIGTTLLATADLPDDPAIDVRVGFDSSLTGVHYGYMSVTDEFVDLGGTGSGDWVSFLYTASEQIAVLYNGYLTLLGDYGGHMNLDTVNPNNTADYLHANLAFDANHDGSIDSYLDLNVVNDLATTGGFVTVPEPPMMALIASALLMAVRAGQHRTRRGP